MILLDGVAADSSLVSIGDCRMFVQRRGQGPPLLLVHSLTFDGDMWQAQIEALAARYQVICVDLHGHGRSEWSPHEVTLDEIADDVASLVDRMGLARVGYAGLSLGGMVGMRLALRHPHKVAALALLNTSAEPEPDGVRAGYHQANESARAMPGSEAMAEFILGLMFSDAWRAAHPAEIAPYRQRLLAQPSPEGLYWVAKAVIWRPDILSELARIAAPTLVLASEGDRAIPVDRGRAIARAIRGSRLIDLGDAGHMTAVERPEAVTGALAELFAGMRS